MLVKSFKSVVLSIIMLSLSGLLGCCGSAESVKINDPKTKIFKKYLSDQVDGQLNVINRIGGHFKNHACFWAVPVVLTVWTLVTISLIAGGLVSTVIGPVGPLLTILAAPFIYGGTGLITFCLAAKTIRCTGSLFEWKSRLFIPTMIIFINNWDVVKPLVPEQFMASFERFVTQYKARGSFTSEEQDLIHRIFFQFTEE